MQTLQTLPLKIFATKKRLSEPVISEDSVVYLALGLLLVLVTYTSRVITLGGSWGIVPVDMPVAGSAIDDPGYHQFKESSNRTIGANTLVIALTKTEMIFGDLAAFTKHKSDVRNKFVVPHLDGSPQVETMLSQFDEWSLDRKNRLAIRSDGIAILVPDSVVPVAVITGVVDHLRSSKKFTHVVLGGEIL